MPSNRRHRSLYWQHSRLSKGANHMDNFIIVRDGEKWGIAQYHVDTSAGNLMHWKVLHWYKEQHEAVAAKQVVHDLYGGKK